MRFCGLLLMCGTLLGGIPTVMLAQGEVVSREVSISNGMSGVFDFADAVSREISVASGMSGAVVFSDAISREVSVFVSTLTASVDPRSTFLRTDPDDAPTTHVVSLSNLGVSPGDSLLITGHGTFAFFSDLGCAADTVSGMVAVFSTSNILLDQDQRFRVPGAIDAGVDYETGDTYRDQLETDIPEDFFVSGDGVGVVVPVGAAYVFIGADDVFWGDNEDPVECFDYTVSLRRAWVVADAPPPADGRGASPSGMIGTPVPNPTGGGVQFSLTLAGTGIVTVDVFDSSGRLVQRILREHADPHIRTLTWRPDHDQPSGVYFVRARQGDSQQVRRLLLLR